MSANSAKKPEDAKDAKTSKATVIAEFRDINNFEKEYKVGDDVSDLHPDRLKKLAELELVKIEAESPADPAA